MKERYKVKKWGGILLSMVLILSMILTPCAAFADTATVPMYLTVSEEPLVFDVTENIQMTATQGSSVLAIDPVTVTNNGAKTIKVSEISLTPASGWSVEASSTDFTTADKTALSFTCGSHDFASGAYAPADAIAIGASKTYTLEGQVSAKADLMTATKVSDLVLTIEKAMPKIVTWADGTDAEIVAMVAAADAGDINLADYWSVGDTRTVHLSAMEATGVGETHAEQDVELVLMHAGGYELADGKTCNFVVGQKDLLAEKGYMNSTETNSGSWDGSARRAWCNSTYRNAIPNTLQPIFKQFKTITAEYYSGNTLKTSIDYFALPAAKELFGGTATSAGSDTGYSNLTEFNALFQFDWYKTRANRIKKLGVSSSAVSWWERSPRRASSLGFCYVDTYGHANTYSAELPLGLAPFGCI